MRDYQQSCLVEPKNGNNLETTGALYNRMELLEANQVKIDMNKIGG